MRRAFSVLGAEWEPFVKVAAPKPSSERDIGLARETERARKRNHTLWYRFSLLGAEWGPFVNVAAPK